jgi:gliding motility associated protien GldN
MMKLPVMKIIQASVFIVSMQLCMNLHAQSPDDPGLDGAILREDGYNKRAVPYTFLSESNSMWAKRVWREMDLREKMNHPFYFPTTPSAHRKNLMQVLMDAVFTEGSIRLYAADDDDFSITLSSQEAWNQFYQVDTIEKTGSEAPYPVTREPDTTLIDFATITKIRLKEDWVFDQERSVMEPRIIGLSPVKTFIDKITGEVRGYGSMFWVYFPQARLVLRNNEIYNRYNFSQRLTYDDIFMKRMFSSRILKIDNDHDRTISAYLTGVNALLEAEEVKGLLAGFEHDVWEQ